MMDGIPCRGRQSCSAMSTQAVNLMNTTHTHTDIRPASKQIGTRSSLSSDAPFFVVTGVNEYTQKREAEQQKKAKRMFSQCSKIRCRYVSLQLGDRLVLLLSIPSRSFHFYVQPC